MLYWSDIVGFANNGNPVPDRRDEKTEAEWQAILTPVEFKITRKRETETAYAGVFCNSYDPGVYYCTCCSTELFNSLAKFDPATGWPGFTQPAKDNAVKYTYDASSGTVRVEVLCNTCDAHLGHVFPDGPAAGSLNYCINPGALK